MRTTRLALGLIGLMAMSASANLYLNSFENDGDTNAWRAITSSAVMDFDSSVPGAITEGSRALKIENSNAGFTEFVKDTWRDGDLTAAVKDPTATKITVDYFIPANTVAAPATYSSFGIRLVMYGTSQGTVRQTAYGTHDWAADSLINVELDLTPYSSLLAESGTYVELEFRHSTDSTISASPIYVDNLQVIPEPATLGLLGVAAAGLIATRRFMI